MIYLDNAATTMIDPLVVEAMLPWLKDQYGNAGSLYRIGREARRAVENARKQVANLINAEPEQIIFTSGGTESNNAVMNFVRNLPNKSMILHSVVEHDSIFNSAKVGGNSTLIPVCKEGWVVPDSVDNLIDLFDIGFTNLVSVMYVNNETGVVNPVKKISQICRAKDVLFHTDCVQALSCKNIDVQDIGCDFLSMSSHKIHGPKGVGALYVKDPDKFKPLILGGKGQEFGLRGGTENVAGIVGFGKACEIQSQYESISFIGKSTAFQSYLSEELMKLNSSIKFYINGYNANNHGKVLSILFPGVDGESLVLMLDAADVCISAGSACRSHETKPSHVLKAMSLSDEATHNSVRISFSRFTTDEELRIAAKEIARCVNILHNITGR